jgi:hypothetical protein
MSWSPSQVVAIYHVKVTDHKQLWRHWYNSQKSNSGERAEIVKLLKYAISFARWSASEKFYEIISDLL